MKAIILAAGYGNRMRPLTDHIHKTLLRVGERTIIERIIDGLQDNEIRDIVVVTGYNDDELKTYLLNHYQELNFQFVHNPRYRETNNIYSLALAFDSIEIDDDIILIESDLIYETQVIERIIKSSKENVALVDRFRSGMDGTVVEVKGGIVTNVIPPHLQGPNFDFSDKYKTLNIYKFSRDFCNRVFKKLLSYYAQVIDDNCYYELILGILIYMQRETIHAEILDAEKWAEVDDPNDLRIAEFVFNPKARLDILEKSFGGYWAHDVLDFCFIRNMYFPNSSILSEMRNNLPELMYNYGSTQEVLNEKLAYFLLCKKENLFLLNGAAQIYPMLKNYFRGKKALIPEPTFGEYHRVFPEADGYSDRVGIDLEQLAIQVQDQDVVVIVNPNNPTGSLVPTEWIYQLAEANPEKTFVVDESFIEFASCPSIIPSLEEKALDNVIVIKSLSKSLGVPGLRLGYVYSCNESFKAMVKDQMPIWNMNSMAEYFLEIILKHRKSLEQSFWLTVRDRERFAQDLQQLSFVERAYPSDANFLLISLKDGAPVGSQLVQQILMENTIYIKDVSNKFKDGKTYLRLAVRLPEENALLVKTLQRVMEGPWLSN